MEKDNLAKIKDTFYSLWDMYVIFYMAYVASLMIIPVQELLAKVFPAHYAVVLFVGLMLTAVYMLISWKTLFRIDVLFPALFLLLGFLSSCVNHQYAFMANIKGLCREEIFFACFYLLNRNENALKVNQFFEKIVKVYSTIWFIAVSGSFYQFLSGVGGLIDTPFYETKIHRVGFFEQRLFGVFSDPNYAAMCSLTVIILNIFVLLQCCEKKYYKIFIIINMVFQWIYIILSGSRTALLAACVAGGVAGFFWSLHRCCLAKYKMHKGVLKSIIVACAVVVAILCSDKIVKETVTYIPLLVESLNGNNIGKINLDREDVVNSSNISNNRFQIWKDAITVWKHTPIIGATYRGYLDFAKERVGDLYIVQKKYSLHNGYISALTFSGILGFLLAIIWGGYIIAMNLKYLFGNLYDPDEHYYKNLVVFSGIVGCGVAALTLSMIFYSTTTIDAIFWCMCGFSVFSLQNLKK